MAVGGGGGKSDDGGRDGEEGHEGDGGRTRAREVAADARGRRSPNGRRRAVGAPPPPPPTARQMDAARGVRTVTGRGWGGKAEAAGPRRRGGGI